MADSAHIRKPLRVLVSEGSSTSAREAVTILGLSGHLVEVCDPNPYCLARFSRFVRKFHHCPGLRDDPAGFLRFIEQLLAAQHFDVLLPTHEQGFVFARARAGLSNRVGLALPDFESYRIVKSEGELCGAIRFPSVVKTSIGTASRGVWFVRNAGDLEGVLHDLNANDAFADEVLVQDLIAGAIEKAQAVFCRGALLGFHAYRQIAAGAGGGEAIKQSVHRPDMRKRLAAIGDKLAWHGALSVDYIVPDDSATPLLIDCNPRLVEPMSGYLAGVDLVGLLLLVSLGEVPAAAPEGRADVRTRLAMQALLGCAMRNGTRRGVAGECWRLLRGSGPYAGSTEELTPLRLDWVSAVPLVTIAIALLASPQLAESLAKKGWGAHLLEIASIRQIEAENFR
jgi:hypothetical protein